MRGDYFGEIPVGVLLVLAGGVTTGAIAAFALFPFLGFSAGIPCSLTAIQQPLHLELVAGGVGVGGVEAAAVGGEGEAEDLRHVRGRRCPRGG